ncbi:MAG: fibronectin type III domain-containing protein [Eubacteriales bacterium]|nr:fibronectin type III domain-containing protein [Eubacteriales bacterium]
MEKRGAANKIATLFLVIAMAVLFGTAVVFADTGGDVAGDESVTVYFTLSDDSEFKVGYDPNETVLARVPVKVSYVDLADYGLEKFYRYEADSFEDGGKYKNKVIVRKPTLLMLYLKALGTYYLDRPITSDDIGTDTLTITGDPTSLYMTRFWNHDENLMYYVNHEYPLMAKGWGSTSDYIILQDGDEIDVAMFTDWNFYHYGAFCTFDNNNPHLKAGGKVTLTMTSSGTSADVNGETVNAGLVMSGEKIRISDDYGKSWKATDYVTDSNGSFTAEFKDPGVYYISAGPYFHYQDTIDFSSPCVAPPIAVAEVAPGLITGLECNETSESSVRVSWDEMKGADGYIVNYRKEGDTAWTSGKCEENSFTANDLDPHTNYEFRVKAYVTDKYVPTGDDPITLEGKFSDTATGYTKASELYIYKSGLKAALDTYRDSSLYREEERESLRQAIEQGEKDIDAAEDSDAADRALEQAENAIDEIPTAEEVLSSSKESARKQAVEYYRTNMSNVDSLKGPNLLLDALDEIDAADSDAMVDGVLTDFKAGIDSLVREKTEAEAKAREKAEKAAREKALMEAKKSAMALRVSVIKLSSKSRKIKISWKKISSADGYEISYKKTSGKYKTLKTIKSYKTSSFRTGKLTKKTKYCFRLRTYNIINGSKVYGKWSAAKSIKCK